MVWFNFLKELGLFNPETNSGPVLIDGGYTIPVWEPLNYLEKLADQVETYPEAISEILNIIEQLSLHPKDNYLTWDRCIKILSKLPNDSIPVSLLHYIPVWFETSFDTVVQSSSLMENLLTKFTGDNPSAADIEKAEIILGYMFAIKKRDQLPPSPLTGAGDSYLPLMHLYYLKNTLEKDQLKQWIIQHCSVKLFWKLADELRKILFDFPNGITVALENPDQLYMIRISVSENKLDFSWKAKQTESEEYYLGSIENYIDLNQPELESLISNLLSQLPHPPGADSLSGFFKQFRFAFYNDWFSSFRHDPIHKLHEEDGDNLVEVYALIFREMLDTYATNNPAITINLITEQLENRLYNLPFYKRVIFYVIAENYDQLNPILWKMLEPNDPQHYFSDDTYFDELYYLFEKNSDKLTDVRLSFLKAIIDQGNLDEKKADNDINQQHWRLGWYAALKETPTFNHLYSEYSQKLQTTAEEIKTQNIPKIRVGHMAPLTVADLREMSIDEILTAIRNFKPVDQWLGPSTEGFADELGKTIQEQPLRFSERILDFQQLPHIYIEYIFYGFINAWRNKNHFNWQPVLEFADEYLSQLLEISKKEKKLNYRISSVVYIPWLLSEGMQNDKHAFDAELLPLAKKILLKLYAYVSPENKQEISGVDYATYSLNSTNGKILRAILDYALRKARITSTENSIKWEADIRHTFQNAIDAEIIDAFTLVGMYYQQFSFLDKEWLNQTIVTFYNLTGQQLLAFYSGLGYSRAPATGELYNIFYQHYLNAIVSQQGLTSKHSPGIIFHIITFYLLNLDDFGSDSLMRKLINNSSPEVLKSITNQLWQQDKYLNQYSEYEKAQLVDKVLEVGESILSRFPNPVDKNEEELIESLLHLMGFISVFDHRNSRLIINTIKYSGKTRYFHSILDDLNRIKDGGLPHSAAGYLASILDAMSIPDHIWDPDKAIFTNLVRFLYNNGQKATADKICTRFSMANQLFLYSLYREYNP